MAEEHRDKLRPAPKTPGVTLSFGLADDLLELKARKKVEKLTENGAKSVHG
jgi:hypothetical protein